MVGALSIIRVVESAVAILRQLAIDTFQDTFGSMNSPENMAQYVEKDLSEEKLCSELLNPASRTYFVLLDQVPIGYLKINVGAAQTESVPAGGLEIQRIYVQKEYLGSGIGRRLLEFAIETAQAEDYSFVWLAVWEKNLRAIRFYEKNGFEIFGSHIFQLGEDAQTDLMMRKEIKTLAS
jgi:ribosomal protein S18 acetylase RimI-like enzyme